MLIVIAGKNKCAIEAHKYLRNKYPKHEIIGVGNKDDLYKEDSIDIKDELKKEKSNKSKPKVSKKK